VNKFLAIFATAAFFLTAGAALADNLTLTLTDAGSVSYGDALHGGLYVGPYQISVNGAPSSPMVCDDYATEISVQSSWNANAYAFGQLSQMKFYGNAGFGNGASTADQAYEEVFYLSAQMMLQTDSTNYAAIHYAIWQIMDPGDNPASNGPTAGAGAWLAQAADPGNWQNVNTSDFLVYTPTTPGTSGPGASQEFIQVIDPNNATVPVPSSLILLAAGLLGLAGLRRRPKK
jgi:hypothetical protein